MNRALAIIGGIGAGVAAAYFLDPKKGAERRSMIKEKLNTLKDDASRTLSDATETLRDKAGDFTGQSRGMLAGAGSQGSGSASSTATSTPNSSSPGSSFDEHRSTQAGSSSNPGMNRQSGSTH